MKSRDIIALVLMLLLGCSPAIAQVNPGTSPLSGAKGGTNNAFMQFTGPAASMKTFTVPNASSTLAAINAIQTWTAAQSFTDGTLILLGLTSGSSTIKAPATGGGIATLFPGTDTIVGTAASQSLSNKTLVAPVLGVATGTSLTVGTGLSLSQTNFLSVGSNSTTSSLDVGQDSSHLLAVNWLWNATPGSASAQIATFSFANPLTIDASTLTLQGSSGGAVKIGANTISLGGAFSTAAAYTMSGAFSFTGTLTGITSVTFPTSGTLISSANLGTGVSTALGVNVGSVGSFVTNGGALGTPSSGVGTNLTGTAAGLTAGTVTTNANLTGDVTSVGNATTLTNATVIAKVLTGFVSGAGTVSSADSILSAFQKINGNDALKLPIASPVYTTSITGPLVIGGNGTTSPLTLQSTSGVGAAGADIIFKTGNNGATEAARILNSGNVGIGTNNPQNMLHINSNTVQNIPKVIGGIQASLADSSTGGLQIDTFGANPQITMRDAGGTAASKTSVTSGTFLFILDGQGYDGSAYSGSSLWGSQAAENWSGSAHGTFSSVHTTPIGSTTRTEAMRIQASGGISVGTTNDPGIGSILASKVVQTVATTVASLPTCNAAAKGAHSFVTDATVVAAGNFGGAVAGTGANNVPVYCDGTSWKIG